MRLNLFGLCLISDVFGPSVYRNCPWTICFDIQIVDSSNDPKISALSPMTSPWVSAPPKLDSILDSPPCDTDVMVGEAFISIIFYDSTPIVQESLGNIESTSDRTVFSNFLHDCLLSFHCSKLSYAINLASELRSALLLLRNESIVHTINAFKTTIAGGTTLGVQGLIWWTSDVSYVIPLNPVIGVERAASLTATVVLWTGNQHLRR